MYHPGGSVTTSNDITTIDGRTTTISHTEDVNDQVTAASSSTTTSTAPSTGSGVTDDHSPLVPDNPETGSALTPTTEVRADGSELRTIPTADGGTTTVEHGTDNTVTTTHQGNDGKVLDSTIERPDGTTLVTTNHPDGTATTVDHDSHGATATGSYDATGKLTNSVITRSDGSTISTPAAAADGTYTHTYADATGHITGKVTEQIDANGSRVLVSYDANGTPTNYSVVHKDGSSVSLDPPTANSDSIRTYRDANGIETNSEIAHPDGTTTPNNAIPTTREAAVTSGSAGGHNVGVEANAGQSFAAAPVTILQPDGNLVTFHPDGSQVVLRPGGAWVHTDPHGTVVGQGQSQPPPVPASTTVFQQADGTTVAIQPDGSKELWSGSTLLARFAPDGSRV